jgi:hypothetical protein
VALAIPERGAYKDPLQLILDLFGIDAILKNDR